MYVGLEINLSIKDDWLYTGKPFLIGTVALGTCNSVYNLSMLLAHNNDIILNMKLTKSNMSTGGAAGTLPIVFSRVPFTKNGVKKLLIAIQSGLFFVCILKIEYFRIFRNGGKDKHETNAWRLDIFVKIYSTWCGPTTFLNLFLNKEILFLFTSMFSVY